MNVIVSNLNGNKFSNLDVDVIKSISGEFSAEEIVQSFSNFFFNRMFLDITSIENYTDINNMKKISVGLDVSKIILLLSDDPSINNDYISKLISMGIYNFARTEEEVKYLYDNPNSYKDVAHLQLINDNRVVDVVNTEEVPSTPVVDSSTVRVIGFNNVTYHAGATSLIYMLKKQLSRDYSVICIEVNKNDFMFFNDKDMVSCTINDLSNMISKYKDYNVILLDINGIKDAFKVCSDVIYLMESSTLMINKAYILDDKCFEKVMDKNVVLNKSLLDERDIKLLESESGIKFFSIIPNLNDRLSTHQELFPLLEKLGLYRKTN